MDKIKDNLLEIAIIGGCILLWLGGTIFSNQGAPSSLASGPAVAAEPVEMADLSIELYATTWCGYCEKTRQFFSQKNIRYIEYDIEKDSSAASRMIQRTGGQGVPVIVIGGDIVIRGYDPTRIRSAIYQKTGVQI